VVFLNYFKKKKVHFDGADYQPKKDYARLTTQLGKIHYFMSDGKWHKLSDISKGTGAPEASVSAQLRNLRKVRFGSHIIKPKRSGSYGKGLYEYRLVR